MEEKIKIYIPQNVYQTLLKDMELFEFYKKDHSLNRNEFLNRLIVNYYDNYAKDTSKIYDHVREVLESIGVKAGEAADAASEIIEFTQKQELDLENRKLDVVISMKPTKYSSKTFDYIENFLLHGSSLSGWLRNLMASYVRMPQDKREQIIFKENFEIISEALEKNRMIYFLTSANTANRHIVSPYAISSSKEELFNYLLAEEHGKSYSFRISRIYNLSILNEECVISDNCLASFDKMIRFGPQFSCSADENEPIKIRLSEKGKMMYEKIYLHRPAYAEIDGDIYTFECSSNQAVQYFQRFGRHAVVISPESVRDEMDNFYYSASKAYYRQKMISIEQKESDKEKDIR